jgi:hypothetical protein
VLKVSEDEIEVAPSSPILFPEMISIWKIEK